MSIPPAVDMLEKCDCDAPLRYRLSATGWLVRCTRCRAEWLERLLGTQTPEPPPPDKDPK